MPAFKSLKDLEKHLKTAINEVLKNEAAHAVKKVEQQNIQETVYNSTEPRVYYRRGYNHGLIDERNMKSELIEDGVLEVVNITRPNKSYKNSLPVTADLPELIEYGDGYNNMNYSWRRSDGTDYEYKQPRPFTENTINELWLNEEHKEALKRGLEKKGIKIQR
jgi:hypothetical protein